MQKIEGVVVPIITPIHENEQPNFTQLERLTEYLVDGGVNAIFANGTTGEFARFTMEERAQILDTIVRTVNGRIPVIAGVSDCGTRMVLEHAKRAQDCGADAIVTTVPYYFPTTSEKEQINFFEEVTSSVKIPVLLYNIPVATGCCVSEAVLDEVCAMDNLYGIKDSSGKKEYLDMLLAKYSGKVKLYVGDEKLSYYGLSHGADGLVPSLANSFPKVLASAWAAACKKDWEVCKKHCDLVDEMNILNRFSDSWMSPNIWRKEALAQMGICDSCFTHPYNSVGEEDKAKIAEWIRYYKENY